MKVMWSKVQIELIFFVHSSMKKILVRHNWNEVFLIVYMVNLSLSPDHIGEINQSGEELDFQFKK